MKLTELTKISKFGALSQNAEKYLLNPRPPAAEAFPGIVGSEVNIVTGEFQSSSASWGGSSDSFYEYLLKIYLYDARAFVRYKDRWVTAANSTITHLASNPKGYPDITFLGRYDGVSGMLVPESGHMECFAGGNFMLGGLALNEPTYTEFGLVSGS
jgi:mannosyl-oligosaccharide alpha-1,2-mannosidase